MPEGWHTSCEMVKKKILLRKSNYMSPIESWGLWGKTSNLLMERVGYCGWLLLQTRTQVIQRVRGHDRGSCHTSCQQQMDIRKLLEWKSLEKRQFPSLIHWKIFFHPSTSTHAYQSSKWNWLSYQEQNIMSDIERLTNYYAHIKLDPDQDQWNVM